MGDQVLRVVDAVKIYRFGNRDIRAVDGVTFTAPAAAMSAIIGPSGSGKTTLLNLMGALDTPTSGEVYLEGVALSGLNGKELTRIRRDKVGFVFQQFHLVPNLSAAENVELPMEFSGVSKSDRRRRVGNLLGAVGLTERADHRPARLSGGEQQRVAIARALANDPVVILADEPTGNLDHSTGEQIVSLLAGLATDRDKTVVVVTHDERLTATADEQWFLEDGRISRRSNSGEAATPRQPSGPDPTEPA